MEIKSISKEEFLREAIERNKQAAEAHPELKPACDVITEALEKQIAKKLVYDYRDGNYECPNCGSYIGKSYFFFGEYCQECGQKFDKGKKNENI